MTSLATSAPPPPLEICPVTRVDGEKCELVYSAYTGEEELQSIMDLIDSTLSEPYSIFTYRYFINTWPSLCILTRSRPVGSSVQGELMGVIICKADVHTKSKVKRGYLAMLVVDKTYRKLKICSSWTIDSPGKANAFVQNLFLFQANQYHALNVKR